MPELPEVETVKRGLAPFIEGQVISDVKVSGKKLRAFPIHPLKDTILNRKIIKVGRRGKYLLIHLSGEETLIHHLGMSGSFRIEKNKTSFENKKHDHVIYIFAEGGRIVFHDPRRFGMLYLNHSQTVEDHIAFRHMGPEPLSNNFSGPALFKNLQNKNSPIKTILLDQSIVAGLGNIYVCEALFYSRISPLRPANTLREDECEVLAENIKTVLNKAIESGGSSLRDHLQVDGKLGYFQHSFAVYDKERQACPGCGCDINKTGGIKRVKQAGRSTFYCPQKQV